MTSPILRLDAEVAGPHDHPRLTIYFSHPASAESYHNYLQNLGSFCAEQDCKIAESGEEVSMYLPSDITPVIVNRGRDVILVFEDEDKAMAWEEKMILWTGRKEQKLNLSRSFTVQAFNDKLGLPNQISGYEAKIFSPVTNQGPGMTGTIIRGGDSSSSSFF